MTQTGQQLIVKAIKGDRVAFRGLVLEHSHAMFRLAWRLTGEESAAEDIVQESFIKAWQKIGDFRMESSFKSWLHRITVNTAMDHLRKKSRRHRFESDDVEVETVREASVTPSTDTQIDISTQTAAAMMGLSDVERSALMLKHYEGHSINEIAQMLDITTGACKQTIFRAVKKMRIALQPLVTT
jgi:RNA polymerase sigma-70 factor (ECF subfamily)